LLSLAAATTCHIFKQQNVFYSLDAFLRDGENTWFGIVATGKARRHKMLTILAGITR
jgi:hypothetical protein